MTDEPPSDDTVQILNAWYEGDKGALEVLLRENVDWMQGYVRKELSPEMRQRFDSMDIVQDGMLRVLKYGPKFAPKNRAQFRGFLARVLVNAYRDGLGRALAGKRDLGREQRLPSEGISRVDLRDKSANRPDAQAEARELQEWIRTALELIDPEDREVVVLRQTDGLSFEAIAERLGLPSTDSARMRVNRALPRLAQKVKELQRAARAVADSLDGTLGENES